MHLVVETLDSKTECPIHEVHFEVANASALCTLLGIPSIATDVRYFLDSRQIENINKRFHLDIRENDEAGATLRTRHWTDELPYKIHTNSELRLMLAVQKPLAVFTETYPAAGGSVIPEELFDPYVHEGRFSKREYVEIAPHLAHGRIRRVLYSLIGEDWRIDAHILLWQIGVLTGWNDGFERMEGHLLGYEEWQCDAWISAMNARKRSQ